MRSRFAAAAGCCYYVPSPQPLPVQQQQPRSFAANGHCEDGGWRQARRTPLARPSPSTASSESDSVDGPPPLPPPTCRRSGGHRYVEHKFAARVPPRQALQQIDCDDACHEAVVAHVEPRSISPSPPTTRPPSPFAAVAPNVARRKYKSYEFFSSCSSAGPTTIAEESSYSPPPPRPLRTRKAGTLTKTNKRSSRRTQTTAMTATEREVTRARTQIDNLSALSLSVNAMALATGPPTCSSPAVVAASTREPLPEADSLAAQPNPLDHRDQLILAFSPLATPSPSERPYGPASAIDDLKKRPARMSLAPPASPEEWRKSFEFDDRTQREGSGSRRPRRRSLEGVHLAGSSRRPPTLANVVATGSDRRPREERTTHHSDCGESARPSTDMDDAQPPKGAAARSSPSVLSNTRSILKQAGSYEKTRPKAFIVRQNVAASLVPAAVCYRRHYLKIMFALLVVAPLCGLAASIAWGAVTTHMTSGAVVGSRLDDALHSGNDTDSGGGGDGYAGDGYAGESGGVG